MSRFLSLLSILPLLLASCVFPPKEEWVPAEIPLCSTTRLYEISRMAMEQGGFPVLHQGFDPKTKTFTSGWKWELHPFKGHGFRERAHVQYASSDNAGKMTLSLRVEQQINENLAKPLELEYAVWSPAADNHDKALVMMQYMRSLLGTDLNIGKKAREQQEKEKEYGEWE